MFGHHHHDDDDDDGDAGDKVLLIDVHTLTFTRGRKTTRCAPPLLLLKRTGVLVSSIESELPIIAANHCCCSVRSSFAKSGMRANKVPIVRWTHYTHTYVPTCVRSSAEALYYYSVCTPGTFPCRSQLDTLQALGFGVERSAENGDDAPVVAVSPRSTLYAPFKPSIVAPAAARKRRGVKAFPRDGLIYDDTSPTSSTAGTAIPLEG